VWSGVVVAVEVEGQCGAAFGGAAVDTGVGPFVEQGLDKAFGLAVGARAAGLDPQLLEREFAQCRPICVGDVAGAVVGHHCAHAHAAPGKPGDCAPQEGDRTRGGQVVEDLGVRESGVVVDHHVQVLVARQLS
jgi:hypothetical protein